MAQPFQ